MCHAYLPILLRSSFAIIIALGRNWSSSTIGSVTRAAALVGDYKVKCAVWNLLLTCADGCWSRALRSSPLFAGPRGPRIVASIRKYAKHTASTTLFFFEFSFGLSFPLLLNSSRKELEARFPDIILQFAIGVAVTAATARRWFARSASVSLAWCSQPCNAGYSCLK